MTNAEKLISKLVAISANEDAQPIVMVLEDPSMERLVVRQKLFINVGSPLVETILVTKAGRRVYTARDTDPTKFVTAVAAYERLQYEADSSSRKNAASISSKLVDMFGYLEEEEQDVYMKD